MVRFYRPTYAELASWTGEGELVWREVRRMWRGDPLRRRHEPQLLEVRRAAGLGQCELWLAWNDNPPNHKEWLGPHYCNGIVVTCRRGRRLCVQMAAGRWITSWMPLCVRQMESSALRQGLDIELYVHPGWVLHMARCWTQPITRRRDPGELLVYPTDARAASA